MQSKIGIKCLHYSGKYGIHNSSFIIHIHLVLSKRTNREGPLKHNGDAIYCLPPFLAGHLMAEELTYRGSRSLLSL